MSCSSTALRPYGFVFFNCLLTALHSSVGIYCNQNANIAPEVSLEVGKEVFTHNIRQEFSHWFVWLHRINDTHDVVVGVQLEQHLCRRYNLVALLLSVHVENQLLTGSGIQIPTQRTM